MVVLEDDLLRCIKFSKPGVSEIYGRDLKWLVTEYHEAIMRKKEFLPKKAIKFMYPQIFWVTLPQHKYFSDNMLRHKFNQCLESVVTLHKEMKVLRMKRRWRYEDGSVNPNGSINDDGILTYWASIDEALQFWETGGKKNFSEGNTFVRKMHVHLKRILLESNIKTEAILSRVRGNFRNCATKFL